MGGQPVRLLEGQYNNGVPMGIYNFCNLLGQYHSDEDWDATNPIFANPRDNSITARLALGRSYDAISVVNASGIIAEIQSSGGISTSGIKTVYYTNNALQQLSKNIADQYKLWWHFPDEGPSGQYYRKFYTSMVHVNDINPFQPITSYTDIPITGGIYDKIVAPFNSDDYLISSGTWGLDIIASGIDGFASDITTVVNNGSLINYDRINYRETSPIQRQIAEHLTNLFNNRKTLNNLIIPSIDYSNTIYRTEKHFEYVHTTSIDDEYRYIIDEEVPLIPPQYSFSVNAPIRVDTGFGPGFTFLEPFVSSVYLNYPFFDLATILKLNHLNIKPTQFLSLPSSGTIPLSVGYISDLDMVQQTIFPESFDDQIAYKWRINYNDVALGLVTGGYTGQARYSILPPQSSMPVIGIPNTGYDGGSFAWTVENTNNMSVGPYELPSPYNIPTLQFSGITAKLWLGLLEDKDVNISWSFNGGEVSQSLDSSYQEYISLVKDEISHSQETNIWYIYKVSIFVNVVKGGLVDGVDTREFDPEAVAYWLCKFNDSAKSFNTHNYVEVIAAGSWVPDRISDDGSEWLGHWLGDPFPGDDTYPPGIHTSYIYFKMVYHKTIDHYHITTSNGSPIPLPRSETHTDISSEIVVGFYIKNGDNIYTQPVNSTDSVTLSKDGFYTKDYEHPPSNTEGDWHNLLNLKYMKLATNRFYKSDARLYWGRHTGPSGVPIYTSYNGLNEFGLTVNTILKFRSTYKDIQNHLPSFPEDETSSYTIPGFTLGPCNGSVVIPPIEREYTTTHYHGYFVSSSSFERTDEDIICSPINGTLSVDGIDIPIQDAGIFNGN